MRKIVVSFALLTAMSVLSPSSAQDFDPALFKLIGPVMRVVGGNSAMLASNPGVQKELKMDDDQVKAVKEKVPAMGFGGFGKGKADAAAQERAARMMEKVAQLKDVPEDKLDEKIREVFKEEIEGPAKEVEKILKPEQMTRLKQISRQQGGPGQSGGANAYLKPENVKDLKLTDEQVTKLKTIATDLQKDVGELVRAAGGGGMGGFRLSPETREKVDALNKEANEKAEALITSEQKTKWKELIGEPYTVKFERPMRKKDN